MLNTVTIPKTEYKRLKQIAGHYETIQRVVESDFFAEPPTKNATEVIKELRKTKRYTKPFLQSVSHGLKESSHFSK
ncbi:MAG: hypothetical protein A3J54_00620 [Candidatus Ryanbacteria bacterium RIFCSPHIGHO2_02_FULL_45_13b]|uniref:Uncharacterized protein n=1 Tax=Candidatus Ryanbacteria bacterium RIFCSPHIGHO2_02_FULL_45_13b TaxID=1802117 RepID=A0A1G2G3H5_9BACT|nr:MAG: hypothetical protein A3J54_00620 [Candidatus Ryanbacteria bacterium RIFCSPHIGHO2_02_FULL_45_13b]